METNNLIFCSFQVQTWDPKRSASYQARLRGLLHHYSDHHLQQRHRHRILLQCRRLLLHQRLPQHVPTRPEAHDQGLVHHQSESDTSPAHHHSDAARWPLSAGHRQLLLDVHCCIKPCPQLAPPPNCACDFCFICFELFLPALMALHICQARTISRLKHIYMRF